VTGLCCGRLFSRAVQVVVDRAVITLIFLSKYLTSMLVNGPYAFVILRHRSVARSVDRSAGPSKHAS
jgi:hypothetical protein